MKHPLFVTADGSHSLFSAEHGVSYHSKHGAIQETRHVFIDAALRFKAVAQREITVLETGFGTGLNALMTMLEARRRGVRVHYVAYEAFPLKIQLVHQLNYPSELRLRKKYRRRFLELHQLSEGTEHKISKSFHFTKFHQDFGQIHDHNRYDIIYFDAFAPNAQPELWESPMLERMYRALREDGMLVTYCAKGQVKRNLKAVGFHVETLPGPPGKREMTRASK